MTVLPPNGSTSLPGTGICIPSTFIYCAFRCLRTCGVQLRGSVSNYPGSARPRSPVVHVATGDGADHQRCCTVPVYTWPTANGALLFYVVPALINHMMFGPVVAATQTTNRMGVS